MYTASQLLDQINDHVAALQFARKPHELYDPVAYVLAMGGKRIRPVLMGMAYNMYRKDVDSIYKPAIGIEMYHNYTLLHDDLMDKATLRRGKKTVHKVWDDNTAILSGDAMLVLAYQYIATCPAPYIKEVVDLFSDTALEICEGQQLDMNFEHRGDVKEEEYIEMIRLKTAVLLATSLKMGAILSGASPQDAAHLYNVGVQIGIAFQLQDDLLDVYGDPSLFGKNVGGDILCNKKTFLLIKAMEGGNKQQLAQLSRWSIAQQECCADEKVAAVTKLYNEIGVQLLCQNKINTYYTCAMESLAKVSVKEENKIELKTLINQLMHRQA